VVQFPVHCIRTQKWTNDLVHWEFRYIMTKIYLSETHICQRLYHYNLIVIFWIVIFCKATHFNILILATRYWLFFAVSLTLYIWMFGFTFLYNERAITNIYFYELWALAESHIESLPVLDTFRITFLLRSWIISACPAIVRKWWRFNFCFAERYI